MSVSEPLGSLISPGKKKLEDISKTLNLFLAAGPCSSVPFRPCTDPVTNQNFTTLHHYIRLHQHTHYLYTLKHKVAPALFSARTFAFGLSILLYVASRSTPNTHHPYYCFNDFANSLYNILRKKKNFYKNEKFY
jgi:hypothetical protein